MADAQQPQQTAQQSQVQQQVQPQETQMQPPQQQQHIQQQIAQQQQPRVSSVGTPSIAGIIAPQAPTPQPTLAAASNLRSPGTPVPQLQVIGQPMHGQPYLAQFQGYAQPFMLQNANALAMQMTQMNQINLAALQQQQQQQNRATGATNPGSPGGVLSPAAGSQITTQMPIGNGSNLIPCSVQGMMPQAQCANGGKGQVSGAKGQQITHGQQQATATPIAVAKQQVLPTQTANPQVVLGNIGVFPSQANGNLASGFITQQTANSHQASIRLNQSQMVNNAGQIITSQPVQNIITNQALMQAMASLQMQQGIPLAAAAAAATNAGHQQLINQGQSQMPAFLAGQNLFIRTSGPIPPQPITMTNMQAAAAFAGIKAPQHQQPQQQQVTGKQTPLPTKVILPVSKSPLTAKIQPNMGGQQAKICVPALPKVSKAKSKAQVKTTTSSSSTFTVTLSSSPTIKSTSVTSSATNILTSTAVPVLMNATATSLPLTTAVADGTTSVPTATVEIINTVQKPQISVNSVQPVVMSVRPSSSQSTEESATSTASQNFQKIEIDDSKVTSSNLSTSSSASLSTSSSSMSSATAALVAQATSAQDIGTINSKDKLKSESTLPSPAIKPFPSPDCKLTVVDSMVIEEKPSIPDLMKNKGGGLSVSAAMAAAGLTTIIKEAKPMTAVEPSPITPAPVVEKQRAIVKPQIITHIIEGYVIQEGLEPFPVQQTSLLQEFICPEKTQGTEKESEEEGTSYDEEPPTLLPQMDAHLLSSPALNDPLGEEPKENPDISTNSSPKQQLKCEICQKVAPASTFNNSGRFCSLSCSRRHNVSHTRRVGLFKPKGTSRKRKQMLVGRKGWRTSRGGRLPYPKNQCMDENSQNTNENPVGDEMSSSNSTQDTSSSAASPHSALDFNMDVDTSIPTTDPSKWTVTEVYDFVLALPGCSDYADDFRSQEIDGQALLLLKEDHLMTAMNIKLGPALKICAKINSLRIDPPPT